VSERELLQQTAGYAADFLSTLDERPIRPEASVDELYEALGGPLPDAGMDPRAVRFGEGEHAMRISVSNWRTTEQDVGRSVDSILAAAGVPA
jgi:hypothetical protein